MTLSQLLLKLKHKLPFNGDWIYPTATPVSSDGVEDLAEVFSDPQRVLATIPVTLPSGINESLVVEANRIAQVASTRADTVRMKAQVLLGTSSFVGAVILGVVSFFSQHLIFLPSWVNWILIAFLTLLLFQFGLSLIRSVKVMTREQVIEVSPRDLGQITQQVKSLEEFQRRLIGTRIAVAYRNQKYVNDKVNDLILGQVGFGYGLFYAFVLVLIFVIGIYLSGVTKDSLTKAKLLTIEDVQSEMLTLSKRITQQIAEVGTTSTTELQRIQKELANLSLEVAQLTKRFQREYAAPSEKRTGKTPTKTNSGEKDKVKKATERPK